MSRRERSEDTALADQMTLWRWRNYDSVTKLLCILRAIWLA